MLRSPSEAALLADGDRPVDIVASYRPASAPCPRARPRRDSAVPFAYAQPSAGHNTIADLPAGTIVKVIGKAGGWLQVKVDVNGAEKEGYVSQELVQKQGEGGSIAMETVSKHIVDGPYGWDSKYDIWAVNSEQEQNRPHVDGPRERRRCRFEFLRTRSGKRCRAPCSYGPSRAPGYRSLGSRKLKLATWEETCAH